MNLTQYICVTEAEAEAANKGNIIYSHDFSKELFCFSGYLSNGRLNFKTFYRDCFLFSLQGCRPFHYKTSL
jgi:hypothetical protein